MLFKLATSPPFLLKPDIIVLSTSKMFIFDEIIPLTKALTYDNQ
jgi:hypothetical protein